jgi:hypothetical protein
MKSEDWSVSCKGRRPAYISSYCIKLFIPWRQFGTFYNIRNIIGKLLQSKCSAFFTYDLHIYAYQMILFKVLKNSVHKKFIYKMFQVDVALGPWNKFKILLLIFYYVSVFTILDWYALICKIMFFCCFFLIKTNFNVNLSILDSFFAYP